MSAGSMIGTPNGGPSGVGQHIRDMYADQIAAQGAAYRNTAHSIRAGFENIWITPALRAIDKAFREGRPEE